ncbi:MAG: Spy/CpxP family protein refolding chaperone [Deltaproteobacteria bacterium]|nr:Spy/CpxP family protein refolding chaperone [Deltaproteobacteria bacterium]
MRALSIVMAVVITAFVAIGSAFAGPQGSGQEGTGKNGSHGERGFLKVLEKLALNADQEKEIASILGKYRDEIGKTIAGMMESRQGLREAIAADVYSEDAVRQAAQRVSEQEVQAAVLRARIANEVKSVLTSEQKDKLKNFANRRAGKMKGFADARLANLDKWIVAHAR